MIDTIKLHSLSKKCRTLTQFKQIHAHLLQTSPVRNPFAIGKILSIAATSNNGSFFSYAFSVFHRLLYRNTFMYNNMIRGHVLSHSPLAAVLCYMDMLRFGIQPNKFSFPPLIKACTVLSPASDLIGRSVHAHIIVLGLGDDPFIVSSLIRFSSLILHMKTARRLFDGIGERDVVLWTSMIDGYGKMDDLENARNLFDQMPDRNVISWSAIMAAYCHANEFLQVLHLFKQMQQAGTLPNASILVTLITACANLGAIIQGLWAHYYVKVHHLESNRNIATALVDMYSKCGRVELALSVFEFIGTKDVKVWNAIISGIAKSGDAAKSIELFREMAASETRPDSSTFVAVLCGCTHAGLVNEGLELFEEMSGVYGIEPGLQHYGCLIDLLARNGMLQEAERFIEGRIGGVGNGDANVWGALLSACRTYENIDIAKRVWRKLADLNVADCGIHKLGYNIFKDAGMIMEAKRAQKMISEKGMNKIPPACSLVEDQ